MKDRENLSKKGARLYNGITNFKFVKIFTSSVIFIYIPLLIIGVFIAHFFDPDGYSILTNWISDLGGSPHTPAPYLYDIACIVAGIGTIPFSYYMEKLLAPLPTSAEHNFRGERWRLRLASLAFFSSLIGNIGYIGVGIWSEDRDIPKLLLGMGSHEIVSALAFGGFILGAFFMGWIIVLYDTKIPKILGLYGIIGPLIVATMYMIGTVPPSREFWEWAMLFAILAWVIPLALIVFLKKDLISEN